MYTRRTLTILFFLLCTIMLSSCRHPEKYPFMKPIEEISSIYIVFISFNENGAVVETELASIEDAKTFVDDFQKVDCFTWFGDPLPVTEEGVESPAIKIVYQDGVYELINWCGQSVFLHDKGLQYYVGYSVFDEKQFTDLLNKHLP